MGNYCTSVNWVRYDTARWAIYQKISPNLSETTMVSALAVKATAVGFLGSSLWLYGGQDMIQKAIILQSRPFVEKF